MCSLPDRPPASGPWNAVSSSPANLGLDRLSWLQRPQLKFRVLSNLATTCRSSLASLRHLDFSWHLQTPPYPCPGLAKPVLNLCLTASALHPCPSKKTWVVTLLNPQLVKAKVWLGRLPSACLETSGKIPATQKYPRQERNNAIKK